MVGKKTHEQQQRIIKGEENTKGGGAHFPAQEDLKRRRVSAMRKRRVTSSPSL